MSANKTRVVYRITFCGSYGWGIWDSFSFNWHDEHCEVLGTGSENNSDSISILLYVTQ